MGKRLDHIPPELQTFIEAQHLFFVGTAMAEGRVNVSPKGMDSLRVIGPNKVVWLNLTGSGNETAAHLLASPRMTIMFCAFEGKPLILRLYGTAKSWHEFDPEFEEYVSLFPPMLGTRQILEMDVELVQTSCGYGVPLMEFQEDRTMMDAWAKNRGEARIREYWEEKNVTSLDGHPTNIFGDQTSAG